MGNVVPPSRITRGKTHQPTKFPFYVLRGMCKKIPFGGMLKPIPTRIEVRRLAVGMVGLGIKAIPSSKCRAQMSHRYLDFLPGVERTADRLEKDAVGTVASFRQRRSIPRLRH